MSRHPDNPKWCQNHDRPYEILSQSEWDEAEAAGHITPDHVLARVRNAVEYALGNGAETGLDKDGFYAALVADGMQLAGGIKVDIYPNDHPPPHVHVTFNADRRKDFKLSIETGELLGPEAPEGWAKRLRTASKIVLEFKPFLQPRWDEMQASVQPSA